MAYSKVTALSLVVLMCGICFNSFASNVGGDIEPIGDRNVAVGVGGNFVVNKHLKSGSEVDVLAISITRNEVDYSQTYAKAVLGLTDYFNLYCKIGAVTRMAFELRAADGSHVSLAMDPSFMWGLGATGAYEFGPDKDWIIGLDAEFDMWIAYARSMDELEGRNWFMNVSGIFRVVEVELTPYIAKKLSFFDKKLEFKPYTGVVFDMFDVKSVRGIKYLSGNTNLRREGNFKTRERFPVGIVVGADATILKDTTINVEGRFITEEALGLEGSIRFKF